MSSRRSSVLSSAVHTTSKRYSIDGRRIGSVTLPGVKGSTDALLDLRTVNLHLGDIKRVQDEIEKKTDFDEHASSFRKGMQSLLDTRFFSTVIMIVILINTLMLVLSTWRGVEVRFDYYFAIIDGIFMAIYVAECVLKIYVKRLEYFKEGWDILDFVIVCTSIFEMLAPLTMGAGSFSGGGASIFRILRVLRALRSLRVLRTIRFLENIQVILITCLHSFQSLGAIMTLMTTFLVIFAVVGRGLFATKDPKQFGNFWSASFTLVQLLTLDDWFEIFTGMSDKQGFFDIPAFFYLLSYIIIEYFVFLNLFIAVLVDNFQLTLRDKLVRKAEEKERLMEEKKKLKKQKDNESISNGSDGHMEILKRQFFLNDEEDDDYIDTDKEYKEFMDSAPDHEYNLVEWYYRLLAAVEKQTHMYHNQWACHQKIADLVVDNTDDIIDRR
uniref:cation channel sperm-associated protein 1-like n=1 Tax=Styela clava TaxID=7725 RepID=UPI0019394F28|nr:cation channel sperm-associated protein 1-like [Styela clava]